MKTGLRLSVAAAAAIIAAVIAGSPAMAWNSWCDDEPPVNVKTPAGRWVNINNFIYVPVQDRHLLKQMTVTADAQPGTEPGTTLVTIDVHTPHGGSQFVHVDSSAQRFKVSQSGDGDWDSDIFLTLTIPVS